MERLKRGALGGVPGATGDVDDVEERHGSEGGTDGPSGIGSQSGCSNTECWSVARDRIWSICRRTVRLSDRRTS